MLSSPILGTVPRVGGGGGGESKRGNKFHIDGMQVNLLTAELVR